MSHRHVVYIYSQTPLREDFLIDLVQRAVREAMEHPTGKLSRTEENSLFSAPPEPHLDALLRTLDDDRSYLRKTRSKGGERGERLHETQIDLHTIQRLVQDVRLQQDALVIRDLIPGDRFCSIRIARKKIQVAMGRDFSKNRLEKALKLLEKQGVLARPESAKRLRTIGREVIAS
jgi:hypothetical protein